MLKIEGGRCVISTYSFSVLHWKSGFKVFGFRNSNLTLKNQKNLRKLNNTSFNPKKISIGLLYNIIIIVIYNKKITPGSHNIVAPA